MDPETYAQFLAAIGLGDSSGTTQNGGNPDNSVSSLPVGPNAPAPAQSGVKQAIGTAGKALGPLASLGLGIVAQNSVNNNSKSTAGSMQQNLERTALQIQSLVQSGAMDPGQAIQALQVLNTQALGLGKSGSGTLGTGGNDPNMANAGQIASMTITNVLMNVQQAQTSQMNAPLGNGTPLAGANGTATNKEQLGRMGSNLRAYFTNPTVSPSATGGAPASDPTGITGSPLGNLMQPFDGQDPMAQAMNNAGQIDKIAPPVKLPDLTQIQSKIQAQRF